ncbi:MAG: hypothetical protein ABR521_01515 [Gaiellaceae bacterium]
MTARSIGALVFAMLVAGIVSAGAGAHVSVRAVKPPSGEGTLFTLVVRNDLPGGRVIREVQVELPAAVAASAVPPRAGWQARIEGRTVIWRGGVIESQAFELLSIRGTVAGEPPRLVFRPSFRLDDGTLFGKLERQPVATLDLRSRGGSGGWPLWAVVGVAVLAAAGLVAVALGVRRALRPGGPS